MTSNLSKTAHKISRKLYFYQKEISHRLGPKPHRDQTLLFIIGCQRSGTTLMTEILEMDWNARIYPEHSRLSSRDRLDGLRLNPLPEVETTIRRTPFPLVVLKPLVETQNADHLLEFFPRAKAVWMYRHYKDVAASNLKRFGRQNGVKNLGYIVRDERTNWRAERLSEETRAIVKEHFRSDMDPYDAAALFWYVRNTFFFERALNSNPRIITCRYTDLVIDPGRTMRDIYNHLGMRYPGNHIISEVHTSSVGRGQSIQLSAPLEELCAGMWDRLEAALEVTEAAS